MTITFRDIINRIRNPKPPVIHTEFGGDVPEALRKQAAINLKLDPQKRRDVLAMLTERLGGNKALALRESQRRYPESGFTAADFLR
jgi:hypothetical protein